MRSRRNRIILFGMLTVLSAAVLMACGTQKGQDTDIVMEIDGQPVAKGEYQMLLSDYEAQVKSRYTTKEANQPDFWEAEFDSGKPLLQVMELVREDLLRKKVIARMAKDCGIDAKTDYASILKERDASNKTREDNFSSGKTLYGLASFELKDYYKYVYTGIETQLMEKLKKKHHVSEEALRKLYEERQDTGILDREGNRQSYDEAKGVLESEVLTGFAREDIEKAQKAAKVSCEEEILEKAALEALNKQ